MKSTEKESYLEELLLTFRRCIAENMRKEALGLDLTFSQVEVLRFLGLSGKKTMKNIADHLKITPPSATVIVKEMEKKKLVKRTNDSIDRRVVFIVLTEKMAATWKAISKRKKSVMNSMISKLTEKDQKELERIINILIA